MELGCSKNEHMWSRSSIGKDNSGILVRGGGNVVSLCR
jgi:hypothetical protein